MGEKLKPETQKYKNFRKIEVVDGFCFLTNLTALSCMKDPELKQIHQTSNLFYNRIAYDLDFGGFVDDEDEVQRLGQVLGDKNLLLMGGWCQFKLEILGTNDLVAVFGLFWRIDFIQKDNLEIFFRSWCCNLC